MQTNDALKNKIASFLNCELDCNSGQLSVDHTPHKLEPLIFQFLLLLISHQGEIVSKQEVVEKLWGEKKASDEALRAMVKKTREALSDNARNPSFIKTIPTKGYLLIPHVELRSSIPKTVYQNHKKQFVGVAVLLAVFLVLVSSWALLNKEQEIKEPELVLQEIELIKIPTNKVSAHYIDGSLINITIAENHVENTTVLRIENIDNKISQEAVLSGEIKPQYWLSVGSNKILVTRNDYSSINLIDISDSLIQSRSIQYDTPCLRNYQIYAVDDMSRHFFVWSAENNKFMLLDISSCELGAIAALDFINDYLLSNNLLTPNEASYQSLIWPIPNNEGFVFNLIYNNASHFFVFDSLDTNTTSGNFVSEGAISTIVWDENASRFSFLSMAKQLMTFQLSGSSLNTWNTGNYRLNTLVADCGGDCFVFSDTKGEFRLNTLANPFNQNSDVISDNDMSHIQVAQSSLNLRDEILLAYTKKGIYFLSRKGRNNSAVQILRRDEQGIESLIYHFLNTNKLSDIDISPSEQYLVGKEDGRPFLLDINNSKLSYIELPYPSVAHLKFDSDSRINFFVAQQDLLANRDLLQNGEELKSGMVYQYDINTKDLIPLKAGAKQVQRFSVLGTDAEGNASEVRGQILIGQQTHPIIEYDDSRKSKVLAHVGLACDSCWQVVGDSFYHLYQNPENEKWIFSKTYLLDGTYTSENIDFAALNGQFSIQTGAEKIAIVRRHSEQSTLTKYQGMQQLY